MEQESLPWPEPLPEASLMGATGEDEFADFLEFGMHFPDLETHGPGHHDRQQHPPTSLPNAISLPASTVADQDHLVQMDTDFSVHPSPYNHVMDNLSLDLHSQDQAQAPYSNAAMTPGFYAQEHSQHQQFQNPQHLPQEQSRQSLNCPPHPQQSAAQYVPQGQHVIPPTPNSMELQGNAARYPQRVDDSHDMYDRYTRMNEEQALYTPLISPAMTPLESQFRLPEYTVPGEYFTPLTSPALEAQNSNSNGYPFQSNQQVSEVGFVHSPADNALPPTSTPGSPAIRRQRRRPSVTSRFTTRAKKQQSPSVRPQTRKKSSVLNTHSEEVLNTLDAEQGGGSKSGNANNHLRFPSQESSQDSVSPESLSEPLMPPPALPQPPRQSPAIRPQPSRSSSGEAATPALLMRIQRSQHSQDPAGQFTGQAKLVHEESHDDVMEDVMLPEAAAPVPQPSRPRPTRIDTTIHADSVHSPATSASATPGLEPTSAPLERNPSSIAPSPRTLAMASPNGSIRKSETPKLGPLGRKRQSLAQASPQLRPKISPSIKPLVRGDNTSSDTSALYLASKSNYQHILDGTLLPGVTYPEALAENLSSKRTNHKLAEQGRRNRINNALKEIETLIPPAFVQLKNAKESAVAAAMGQSKSYEKEKEKPANQAVSKASTVEMAIDYIKALTKELEDTKGKLASAEARLSGKNGSDATSTPEGTTTNNIETKDVGVDVDVSPEANGST